MNSESSTYVSAMRSFLTSKLALRQSIRESTHTAINRKLWSQLPPLPQQEVPYSKGDGRETWECVQRLLMVSKDDPTLEDLAQIARLTKGTVRFLWSRQPISRLKSRAVDPTKADLLAESRWVIYNALAALHKGFPVPPSEEIVDFRLYEKICMLDSINSIVAAGIYYGWQPTVEIGVQRS